MLGYSRTLRIPPPLRPCCGCCNSWQLAAVWQGKDRNFQPLDELATQTSDLVNPVHLRAGPKKTEHLTVLLFGTQNSFWQYVSQSTVKILGPENWDLNFPLILCHLVRISFLVFWVTTRSVSEHTEAKLATVSEKTGVNKLSNVNSQHQWVFRYWVDCTRHCENHSSIGKWEIIFVLRSPVLTEWTDKWTGSHTAVP